MVKEKILVLDLDELYTDGCYHTKFDIGGAGHSIQIKEKDKEVFLDAFAKEWRKKAEEKLREIEDGWDD